VIMATHGRGGFDRLRNGSVAEALLRDIPVPVLLIRAGLPIPKAEPVAASSTPDAR